MTPLIFLLASIAGGVGAGLRYLVDIGVMSLTRGRFPWGIVVVNVTGAFALGVVTASIPDAALVIGAGLLGGYTTFSTVSVETALLAQRGRRDWAWLNLLGTLVTCVVAAAIGLMLGGLLPR